MNKTFFSTITKINDIYRIKDARFKDKQDEEQEQNELQNMI